MTQKKERKCEILDFMLPEINRSKAIFLRLFLSSSNSVLFVCILYDKEKENVTKSNLPNLSFLSDSQYKFCEDGRCRKVINEKFCVRGDTMTKSKEYSGKLKSRKCSLIDDIQIL